MTRKYEAIRIPTEVQMSRETYRKRCINYEMYPPSPSFAVVSFTL